MKYILSGIILFLFISCSFEKGDTNKTVFRYNEAVGISSLDPAYAKDLANIWGCNQLYNGLVELDNKLKVKPAIAKEWTISEDGLIYTFNLRDDVFFHDHPLFKDGKGHKVTANDFVLSFNRILDPKVLSPGAWVFNNVKKKEGKTCFTALNDSVFQIELEKPFPAFLSILSMKYCSVVPYEIIRHFGKDFRKNPVGTGPFRFKIWKEGVKLVLVKNENYFELYGDQRLPFLDAVAVSFLKDKQSAFLEFVKGNLDFLSGIDPNYKDELLTKRGRLNPKYSKRFKLISQPYLNTEYLGILLDTSISDRTSNPLLNIKVRKAINYGFNRQKMIKYLRNGIGTPGKWGIIPLGLPAFDSINCKLFDYKPDLSRQLLREAGYANGNGLPEIRLNTTSEYLDLCKYIQDQLSELGIPISIDVNPPGALREMKAQARLEFFRASWIADYPDAENYFSMFYSKNFCPSGPNYTHFSNPVFDCLYEKSQTIMNDSLRIRNYQLMNEIIIEEAPVVVLYYDQVLRFVRKNIIGLGSNPINLLDLRKVKKIN